MSDDAAVGAGAGLPGRWRSVGRIAHADGTIDWLGHFAGSACVLPGGSGNQVEILVTGRDAQNRSIIGRGVVDLDDPTAGVHFDAAPALVPGGLGAFDENGVSYPCAVQAGDELRLYYTGWMPTVLTPFQNHIGLAQREPDGSYQRVSRAPILDRTDDDHLSLGSCFVLQTTECWLMWYTTWRSWGSEPGEPKHRYLIKVASSEDGLTWHRDGSVAIGPVSPDEHSIARPTVIHRDGTYHMWFCSRGDHYRLGYATSADGVQWTRRDREFELTPDGAWDDEEQCYPAVFERDGQLWMLYCGNGYGREGLGLARFEPAAGS